MSIHLNTAQHNEYFAYAHYRPVTHAINLDRGREKESESGKTTSDGFGIQRTN